MVRRRNVTDEELLRVASECFIEHGPGVSTTVIADEAGVSQATLFKRFGTKQELMMAALAPKIAPALLTKIGDGPQDGPIYDQLLALGLKMNELFDRMLPCVMLLWASGTDPKEFFPDPDLAPPVLARRALARFIAQAQSEGRMGGGDPEALAMGFIGSIKELTFQKHMLRQVETSVNAEVYVRTAVDAIWSGCAPKVTP